MRTVACPSCGTRAPFREVTTSRTYQIINRHNAPCGEMCAVGCLNGEPFEPGDMPVDNLEMHGPYKCPSGCLVDRSYMSGKKQR